MYKCGKYTCKLMDAKLFILVVSFAAQTIQFGIVWTVGLFNVFFLEAFGSNIGKTSLICSLHTSFFYAAGPVSGALVNKYGYRVTCIGGSIMAASGLLASALAPNIYLLYLSFGVLTGFGLGISYVPCLSIIALYYPRHQTLAFSVATSGVGLGVMVFPFLIEYLAEFYGWRGATLITAGMALQLCVLGAFLNKPTLSSLQQSVQLQEGTREPEDGSAFNLKVFQNISYVSFCIHNLLYWFAHSVVSIHLPTYAYSLGLSNQKVGLLISVTGLTGFIGKFPVGFVTLHQCASPIRVYTLGLILCCLVTIMLPLATSYAGLLTYAALFGFLLSMICGCLPSVVVDILDVTLLPSGFGYILLFEAAGSLLGAPIAGHLYDITHRYNISFYLSGTSMFISIILMVIPFVKLANVKNKNEMLDKLVVDRDDVQKQKMVV